MVDEEYELKIKRIQEARNIKPYSDYQDAINRAIKTCDIKKSRDEFYLIQELLDRYIMLREGIK